jgi:hypothetical protein
MIEECKKNGHELVLFEDYFMKMKSNNNVNILDIIPSEIINKYCAPQGLIGLANKALADFNLGESYRLFKLLYFMGIYEVSGVLFHLHFILGSLEEASLVLKKMRELKMDGTFLKEAQLFLKLNKNKKDIAKFLIQNWDEVKIEGDLIGQYSLQLSTFLMVKPYKIKYKEKNNRIN